MKRLDARYALLAAWLAACGSPAVHGNVGGHTVGASSAASGEYCDHCGGGPLVTIRIPLSSSGTNIGALSLSFTQCYDKPHDVRIARESDASAQYSIDGRGESPHPADGNIHVVSCDTSHVTGTFWVLFDDGSRFEGPLDVAQLSHSAGYM